MCRRTSDSGKGARTCTSMLSKWLLRLCLVFDADPSAEMVINERYYPSPVFKVIRVIHVLVRFAFCRCCCRSQAWCSSRSCCSISSSGSSVATIQSLLLHLALILLFLHLSLTPLTARAAHFTLHSISPTPSYRSSSSPHSSSPPPLLRRLKRHYHPPLSSSPLSAAPTIRTRPPTPARPPLPPFPRHQPFLLIRRVGRHSHRRVENNRCYCGSIVVGGIPNLLLLRRRLLHPILLPPPVLQLHVKRRRRRVLRLVRRMYGVVPGVAAEERVVPRRRCGWRARF